MSRHETTFYLKSVIIAIFVVLISGYALFELKGYLTGPQLINVIPESGAMVTNHLTVIAGDTKNIKEITLNGRAITVDEYGHFEEETLLSYGYNIITLKARDRFNNEVERNIELFFK